MRRGIDVFYYQGPILAEARGNTFHVMLYEEDDDGSRRTSHGPYTPAQAKAMGYDIKAIFDEINSNVLSELEAMRNERDAARAERDQFIDKANKTLKTAEYIGKEAMVMAAEKDAVIKQQANRIAELEAEQTPKKSFLNAVTFGLVQ